MTEYVKDIDRGWNKITKEISKMKVSTVKVGVLSAAGNYSQEGGAQNLADVAIQNEFGVPSKRIPPRPFMAQSADQHRTEALQRLEKGTSEIFAGKSNVVNVLSKIGVWFVGKVREQFTKGNFKPNTAFTVAKKGSSTPLIDTGRLRQSIQHELEIGKK